MDHWSPAGTGLGAPEESTDHSRALTSISGNAQSFATDSKVHFDSEGPVNSSGRVASDLRYHSAFPVLGSNDKHMLHERLVARKARRRTHPLHDRPYLQSDEYKNYRARKRQDAGKDGKPIWPDHIEEAFQNAMVHIPPMGRSKKAQCGKPYGRNELVAEWIYQETGESRDRKQISSHIQLLGAMFKNIPEWNKVAKKRDGEDGEDNDKKKPGGRGFYYGSIADQVRIERQLAQAAKDGLLHFEEDTCLSQRHGLSRITFELWVGAPDNITQALHNYTRVSNNHSPSPTVPLEDFDNWRELFPDLEATLQANQDENFEVVLVRSSIALMSDFPPTTSKLGLVLDLDFRNAGRERMMGLGDTKHWSSINHMYLHGQPLRKTEHKECQSAEFGLVKPFFEADWWASHFSKLTHKRKEAENSQNEEVLTDAKESCRKFFRGLSIMQEVFASPFPDNKPRRRMAVLLWVVSQANKGQAGVTSWQKVIPPPHRLANNSPLARPSVVESSLPPLVLDSMMESSFDTTMSDEHFEHYAMDTGMSLSPTIYEAGAYHTGFTPLQSMGHDQLKFYDFSSTGLTPRGGNLADHKDGIFDFNAPMLPVSTLHHPQPVATYHGAHGNIFDHLASQEHEASFSTQPVFASDDTVGEYSSDRQQCLAKFDTSTHRMLQTQLSKVSTDFAMLEPESQQSVTAHMDNLAIGSGVMSQGMFGDNTMGYASGGDSINLDDEHVALSHPSVFQSPRVSRPRLLQHNSFAGVLRTTCGGSEDRSEHERLGFDTPTRNGFARLLENHYVGGSDDNLLGGGSTDKAEGAVFAYGSDMIRPRSQPVLPSNVSPVAAPRGWSDTDSPRQEVGGYSYVKMEQG